MNRIALFTLVSMAFVATSCQRAQYQSYDDNVVVETYVHKYGVEVPATEWSSRGESGKVISTLATGVKVSKTYVDGVLDGETTYTFPHSETIQKQEYYENGKLVKETQHNILGAPEKEIHYFSSTHKGITTWYDNGSPLSEEEYEGTKLLNGDYFSRNHQLESRVEDGSGTRTQRDSSGLLISTDTIRDGQAVLITTYYPTGAPKSKTPYQNGLVDGQIQTFSLSGEPNTIETWVAGKQNGITTIYQNGEKYSEIPYVNGIKQGTEKHYRDGSQVVEENTWNNNQRHGPARTYIENTVKTDWYYKDKPVSQASFEQMSRPLS